MITKELNQLMEQLDKKIRYAEAQLTALGADGVTISIPDDEINSYYPSALSEGESMRLGFSAGCLDMVVKRIGETETLRKRIIDLPIVLRSFLAGYTLELIELVIRWMAALTKLQFLAMGLLWVVLTVLFEIGLGRLVLGMPWKRITEEYDVTLGGFMGLGLLFMAAAPWLAAWLQGSPRR